jgi:hypothetical protein
MPAIAADHSTVVILNEAGVRARYLPALADAAKLYQVALVGAAIGAPLSATASPASMLYDTPEFQLKREAREEKLAAVTVCLRGDLQAVNTFVGPVCDLGHDSVLARIYPMLSMVQRARPWARPECLPLFLQFLFSPSYLVLKGQGINLTAQHLLPTSKSDSAVQIETVSQIEQCAQALCSGFTTLYCQPGSPLHKLDPLFFYNITVPLLEQLRSTTHQSEYLLGAPHQLCCPSIQWMPRRPGFIYVQHGQRFSSVSRVSSRRYGNYGPEAERDGYGRVYGDPLPAGALYGSAVLPFLW